MTSTTRIALLGVLMGLALPSAHAQDAARTGTTRFLQDNHTQLALTAQDVDALTEVSRTTSPASGLTVLYLQQQIDGIPVHNAIVNVAVAANGEVVSVGNRAVSNLAKTVVPGAAAMAPEGAVLAAARSVGIEIADGLTTVGTQRSSADKVVLRRSSLGADDITAQLTYIPTERDGVRLAWLVTLDTPDGLHLWQLGIDAASGAVLLKEDLVVSDTWHAPDAFTSGWPLEAVAPSFAPLASAVASPLQALLAGSYRVYGAPAESPSHTGDPSVDQRTLVVSPADPAASPLGWHATSTNSWTVTRGNNVHAYTDIDANNIADPGSDPDGGAGLLFDFPFVPATQAPANYRPAAVTNLFYWNNVIHDVMHRYGFDEASGNFQVDNFGNGGLGNDDVRAEAQDGSGTNNANFGTPADGSRPRMQMFRWTAPAFLTVNGGPLAGTYAAGSAGFGPPLTAVGTTGLVALASDGVGAASDACEPLVGFPAGQIALVDRGTCTFTTKVKNAQNAGAIAAIVVNNVAGPPSSLGGTDPTITIPSVMISLDTGNLFKVNLPLTATLAKVGEDRDSDFDAGIIAHEYGHGISNRLTGGPATASCLGNLEQMGEGWSDFFGLILTDTDIDHRGVGTYSTFQPTSGRGIRTYPYNPSFAVNPSTYNLIKTAAPPHGVGSVWATTLWDMTRDLVRRHGFNPDLTGAWDAGGNNLALQLVTDGLKIQPCRPGFVDGRNAIMAADAALTGNANQCLIWDAFARRGLGFSADQGLATSVQDGTEAFDLPVTCSTVAMVRGQVSALQTAGVLNRGQANSLLVKLDNAEKKLAQGQPAVALSMLTAFLNEVNALVSGAKLTTDQGQVLTDYAQGFIHRIEEGAPGAAEAMMLAKGATSTGLPVSFELHQSAPNPFRDETRIGFGVPEASHVRIVVYDLMGREVARLLDGDVDAGYHQTVFDARGLASGIYLYRMEAGTFSATARMVVVR